MDRTKSQESEGGRGRIQSETAVSRRRPSIKHFEKSSSFGNVKKCLASKQSIEEERSGEDGTDRASAKKLTNLRDFYSLPGQSEPEKKEEETPSPCAEVPADVVEGEDPFDWVGYSQANSALTVYCRQDQQTLCWRFNSMFSRLPPPPQFGHGNPFLMFLCLACLLEVFRSRKITKNDKNVVQHRDHIMRSQLDYQDIAMYFDKLVRSHDVHR